MNTENHVQLVERYGKKVFENEQLDPIRKDTCMCHCCGYFRPGEPENCRIAEQFYKICVEHGCAFILTRCENWMNRLLCSGCAEPIPHEKLDGSRFHVIGTQPGGWVKEVIRETSEPRMVRMVRIRPPIMEYLCPTCAIGTSVRPGSLEARKVGCTCPTEPNATMPCYESNPNAWDVFTFDANCPIHAKLRSWRDYPGKGETAAPKENS